MNITTRKTYAFTEIKVDELETTVFKSSQKEIADLIMQLLDAANELATMSEKSLQDYLREGDFI